MFSSHACAPVPHTAGSARSSTVAVERAQTFDRRVEVELAVLLGRLDQRPRTEDEVREDRVAGTAPIRIEPALVGMDVVLGDELAGLALGRRIVGVLLRIERVDVAMMVANWLVRNDKPRRSGVCRGKLAGQTDLRRRDTAAAAANPRRTRLAVIGSGTTKPRISPPGNAFV